MEQIRELSHSLHPSMLDDLGLVSAVRWFAKRYQSRMGIRTELHCSHCEEALDPEIALAVYRVVQESLTNVAKHSQATRVRITLKKEGGSLSGMIEDNGRGFDQEKAAAVAAHGRRGMGLVSMRERIASVDGEFSVHSQSGQGTRILFRISLKEEVA